MPYVTVGEENSAPIEIFYEDHGQGRPVVLIHGFPLSGRAWERQERALLAAGRRVITYDRRGFGRSSQPTTGYDYDTFAADLDKLLAALDLTDVDLAGHSMGGGEIARYLGTYGSARIGKAVIVSGVPPYLLKTAETPQGVPQEVFDEIAGALVADRFGYFTEWNKSFFNLDETLGKRISPEAVQDAWNTAVSASPTGTIACVATWITDFRADLPKIDIPVLVLHGTADRILPIDATGARTHELIKDSEYVAIEGADHGLCWTYAEEVNAELLRFLG
ncbi:alpha/beta hydrolase fold protein [Catenulispora acidiphila DSM 44928]|uniref:Alpha/beta hydrolase fold protein n=1 Tax=Catenulispora acidiphila (strain DSM 44928 / JCM 14897 / NBRC 102108 / NRRL B-24433 / ID139908) TaxID=479433 RepID=C7PZE9_CATAD|nr:alpha/beta hydrolase [Catenulispora acidiphila]ACU71606.1 alpha/beta hydrolase fold protein [Catenulispora acidiphila DSM 44928]